MFSHALFSLAILIKVKNAVYERGKMFLFVGLPPKLQDILQISYAAADVPIKTLIVRQYQKAIRSSSLDDGFCSHCYEIPRTRTRKWLG